MVANLQHQRGFPDARRTADEHQRTLNGAAAIDMADQVGSVEAGKKGDLVIWDAPDLDYICYRVGSNLARTVIKRGRIV